MDRNLQAAGVLAASGALGSCIGASRLRPDHPGCASLAAVVVDGCHISDASNSEPLLQQAAAYSFLQSRLVSSILWIFEGTRLKSLLPLLSSTLLYSTLRYSTLLYSTLLYSTLLYSTLLYSTLLFSTLLYTAGGGDGLLFTCIILQRGGGRGWREGGGGDIYRGMVS
jgi:hypothetical protein